MRLHEPNSGLNFEVNQVFVTCFFALCNFPGICGDPEPSKRQAPSESLGVSADYLLRAQ